MRVSAKFASAPTACETDFDGEVEDYALVVSPNSGMGLGRLFGRAGLISPNPSTGEFSIQFDALQVKVHVLIYSQEGQVVSDQTFSDTSEIPFDLDVASGIYYVVTEIDEKKEVFKLIISE